MPNTAELAKDAHRIASEAMETINSHVKECIEGNRRAEGWRASTTTALKQQGEALDSIKKFLGKIMLAIIGSLLVAIAVLVFYGSKGIHQ